MEVNVARFAPWEMVNTTLLSTAEMPAPAPASLVCTEVVDCQELATEAVAAIRVARLPIPYCRPSPELLIVTVTEPVVGLLPCLTIAVGVAESDEIMWALVPLRLE